MKKIFFIGALLAIVATACQKNETPGSTKNLVYDGPTKVVIEEGTNFYSINFTANADWKIEVACNDNTEELSVVTVDKKKGTAGTQTVKVTLDDLLDGQTGRLSMVAISTNNFADESADNNAQVYFMQGKVFALATEEDEVGVEGGTVTYKIITNSENISFTSVESDWATIQWNLEDDEVVMTAKANKGYDPRSEYAVFRTADILVDSVSTETWEPTGIMVPASFYATINQEGNIEEIWRTEFDQSIALASTHTIAKFGSKVYVANAQAPASLFVYDAETGASEGTLDITGIDTLAINSIAADDAGNLVLAFGGAYGGTFDIFKVKAGKTINAANAENLVSCINSIYGFGLDNIKVTGDVTGSAAISAVTGYGTGEATGEAYAASWQITGGTAVRQDYTATSLPAAADIWYAGDLVAVHETDNIDNGFFYLGYDSHYDLCYRLSSANDWIHTSFNAGVTGWGENFSAMDVITWNNHKYMSVLANTFFVEWGMASYLSLLKVDDTAEPAPLSCTEYFNNGGVTFASADDPNARTADVCAVVEDGSLAVYAVDGGNAYLMKIVYPAL